MAEPAHKASTEHPAEGGHGGFPPFNAHTFPSQLIWLAIFFVLLYALMAKWALPQVGRVIERRQKLIEDDFAEAGRLKVQSDEAVAAYEKALADARARAQASPTRRAKSRPPRPRPPARRSRASSTSSWRRPRNPSPPPSRRPWPTCAPSPRTPRVPSSSG